MKTAILTLITAVSLTATGLAKAEVKPSSTNNNTAVVLAEVTRINRIEARGNVEVYITNGTKDEVKVFDNYYAQNALVQGSNGTLRISSYKADKLVVLVTVTDLQAISAYDNASIKSQGRLSALDLEVKLNNTASAQLKLDAVNAKITANDGAKADLSGNVEDYTLSYDRSSTVNRTGLIATNRNETVKIQPVRAPKVAEDDLAAL